MICTSAFDQHNTKMCIFMAQNPCWAFLRVYFQFQSLWSERWLVYLCHHPSSTHHPLKMSENAEHADKNVEIWKVKKLIKSLEAARGNLIIIFPIFLFSCVFVALYFPMNYKLWCSGNGTSMISLIIPPGDQACVSLNLSSSTENSNYPNSLDFPSVQDVGRWIRDSLQHQVQGQQVDAP